MDPKRIKVSTNIQDDYQEFITHIDSNNMDYLESSKDKFYKIEKIVIDSKLYQNPNLTIQDVAFEIKMPVSMVNNSLKAAGYASFSHFIAKCRVVELKVLLLQNNGRNILDLYSQVGFNNRAAASKYFKLFVGTTASDWIKQQRRSLYINNE